MLAEGVGCEPFDTLTYVGIDYRSCSRTDDMFKVEQFERVCHECSRLDICIRPGRTTSYHNCSTTIILRASIAPGSANCEGA